MSESLQLSKYPALNNLERQTSVPKAYAVIGLVVLYFFLIVFNLGGQLLTNLAGFLIPGYYSLEALFTAAKTDDTQWLTVCICAPNVGCILLTMRASVLGCLCPLHVRPAVYPVPAVRASNGFADSSRALSASSTGSPSTTPSNSSSCSGSPCRPSGMLTLGLPRISPVATGG